MEITGRTDIGTDLHAPSQNKEGQPHWSYELVREVSVGDRVYHYDTKQSAIVGVSQVIGEPWVDKVLWAARGTASRNAGIEPHLQDGW
jgi:hypothetical protein